MATLETLHKKKKDMATRATSSW